ncbi:hypothetical protein QR685DRAFT_572159 [Neurospora intermedia]|uniref:CFEM domain-containing protein n=1 Tax=Neurospora intermedia TaxID=5142 RepID=A0ABR3DFK8_NEUIN
MQYITILITLPSSVAFTSARPQTSPPVTSCPISAQMPECGVPCISAAAIEIGCTKYMGFGCQCQNTAAMQAAVMPCLAQACGAALALARCVTKA